MLVGRFGLPKKKEKEDALETGSGPLGQEIMESQVPSLESRRSRPLGPHGDISLVS